MIQFSRLTASLALAACLSGAALAQTSGPYDYTTTTEYHTYTSSYPWTPDARTQFTTVAQSQGRDLYPIFWQGRSD